MPQHSSITTISNKLNKNRFTHKIGKDKMKTTKVLTQLDMCMDAIETIIGKPMDLNK